MWSTAASSKHCAACANWAGERTIKGNSSFVECKDPNVKGKCYMGQSGGSSQGPSACQSCPKFTKWAALK